jgi:competence protein ComFC
MKNLIANIKKLIFRSKCAACNKEETENNKRICNECLKKLKYSSSLKNRGSLFYIWKYEEIIKNLTESHKFNGIRDISIETSEIIREKLIFLIKEYSVDIVIPIPISKKRERERGFNQAEDILTEVGINWTKAERIRETEHMYKILDSNDRKKNIKESFKIENSSNLENKVILIFDDIVTTGATFFEIRREIHKRCIPKKIIFFALAASKYSIHKGVDLNGNE